LDGNALLAKSISGIVPTDSCEAGKGRMPVAERAQSGAGAKMSGILELIATKAFPELLTNVISTYKKSSSSALAATDEALQTDLRNHFDVAYNKCRYIKTILNDKPIDLLTIHVEQHFSSDNKPFDQYDFIERARNGESFVLVGTGGGGKSMFMRYFWLSIFEALRRKKPIIVELRQLNALSHKDLESFIYHAVIRTGSKISQANFSRAIKNGDFFLLLDGFDEINYDFRNEVEQAILALREINPRLTIVVTSRPDERFSGWQQFTVANVAPLSKEQVINLVERAPFPHEHILYLLSKIKKGGLYETHQSFLSNPLIAYMMLVTLAHDPYAPDKMFNFYAQAFEALFHRHDMTKAGFKRKFYTQLDRHAFSRLLSYIGLISYTRESFEFRDATIIEWIKHAATLEAADINPQHFLLDLLESVCIVKKEGLDLSFTHRSFQEYFAAFCIAQVANKNLEKIFDHLSKRYNDQVISMVYEINPFVFREKYILPLYKKYQLYFDNDSDDIETLFCELSRSRFNFLPPMGRYSMPSVGRNSKSNRVSRRGPLDLSAYLESDSVPFFDITLDTDTDFATLWKISRKITSNKSSGESQKRKRRHHDERFFCFLIKNLVAKRELGLSYQEGAWICHHDGQHTAFDKNLETEFKRTRMFEYLFEESRFLKQFVLNEIHHYERVSASMEDLI
jgi:hypothetical protein